MAVPATRAAIRQRFVSMTTWFFQPELGMTRYEVLSRASACAVCLPGTKDDNDRRWSFLTSQHVTHPFRYPQYYAEPKHAFVHLLTEADVRYTLEVRDSAGRPLCVGHTDSHVVCSPLRDVSMMRFPDVSSQNLFLHQASAAGYSIAELQLAEERPADGSELTLEGHVLQPLPQRSQPAPRGPGVEEGTSDVEVGAGWEVGLGPEDEDGHGLHPRSVSGRVFARSDLQVFVRTATVLEMGMCGGPVVDARGHCVGVVEGIVPTKAAPSPDSLSSRARNLLAGCAVYVEGGDLAPLLQPRK